MLLAEHIVIFDGSHQIFLKRFTVQQNHRDCEHILTDTKYLLPITQSEKFVFEICYSE